MSDRAVRKGTPAELAVFIKQEQNRHMEEPFAIGRASQLQLLAWLWVVYLERPVEELHAWTRTQGGWVTFDVLMLRDLAVAVEGNGRLDGWRKQVECRFARWLELRFWPVISKTRASSVVSVRKREVMPAVPALPVSRLQAYDLAPEVFRRIVGSWKPLEPLVNHRGFAEPVLASGGLTVEFIIRWRVWFEASHIGVLDVKGSRRSADIVKLRQEAIWLAKMKTQKTLPEIGRIFGGKDHTTVLHAVSKIASLRDKDAVYKDALDGMLARLHRIRMAKWIEDEMVDRIARARDRVAKGLPPFLPDSSELMWPAAAGAP